MEAEEFVVAKRTRGNHGTKPIKVETIHNTRNSTTEKRALSNTPPPSTPPLEPEESPSKEINKGVKPSYACFAHRRKRKRCPPHCEERRTTPPTPTDDIVHRLNARKNEVQPNEPTSPRASPSTHLIKKNAASSNKLAEFQKLVLLEREALEEEERKKALEMRKMQEEQIKLDVGGTHYTTSVFTLTKYPLSYLGDLFSGKHPILKNEEGRVFIDRDGHYFRYILDFLRDGEWLLPKDTFEVERLEKEARFFGIPFERPQSKVDHS